MTKTKINNQLKWKRLIPIFAHLLCGTQLKRVKETKFLNLLSIQPPLSSLHNPENAIGDDICISEENQFVGGKSPKKPK